MKAEDRILIAVEKVEKKVDTLTDKFTTSEIETAIAITKIQEIEAQCPIKEVETTLRKVQITAEHNQREAKRISAIIAGVVGAIWAAILAVFGWHNGGSNG